MSVETSQQGSEQVNSPSTPWTHVGRVKWFNNKRGYGFISIVSLDGSSESQEDVFVHQTNIHTNSDVYRTLSAGEYVSFALSPDEKGNDQAVSVTGVAGGPLLCETSSQRSDWAWNNYNGERRDNRQGGRRRGGDRRGQRRDDRRRDDSNENSSQ